MRRDRVNRSEVSSWFYSLYRDDMRYKDRPTILDCADDLNAEVSAIREHWPSAPDIRMRLAQGEPRRLLSVELAERHPEYTQAMCAYLLDCTPSTIRNYASGLLAPLKSDTIVSRLLEAYPTATLADACRRGLSKSTAWRMLRQAKEK